MNGSGGVGARSGLTLVAAGLIHLAVGTVGLFMVFLIAYAFADEITATLHVIFLLGFAVVAGLSTMLAGATAMLFGFGWRLALALAAATTSVAYGLALAAGTVVSLLNEDQGSVTAQQPDWPFLTLIAISIVVFVAGVVATRRLSVRR